MKKLIALGLLAASITAHAEWVLVAGSSDGKYHLLAESGSLQVGSNSNNVIVAAAKFAVVTDGKIGGPIAVAIELASCANGGGQIAFSDAEDKESEVKINWWTQSGGKFYDSAARLLCASYRTEPRPKKSVTEKDI